MSHVTRIGDPIGSLVKFQRLQAGMTQGQLAERSGIERGALADLEEGVVGASDQDVQAIAGALGVTPSALLAKLPEGLVLTTAADLLNMRGSRPPT